MNAIFVMLPICRTWIVRHLATASERADRPDHGKALVRHILGPKNKYLAAESYSKRHISIQRSLAYPKPSVASWDRRGPKFEISGGDIHHRNRPLLLVLLKPSSHSWVSMALKTEGISNTTSQILREEAIHSHTGQSLAAITKSCI